MPRRNYLLAALVALAALALVLVATPGLTGLKQIAPDRILVMEPGEQHQARHPASVGWALDFADQFAFTAETSRQRTGHGGARGVSPEERQWHFRLNEAEVASDNLAVFIPNAAGTLSFYINGTPASSGTELPRYSGPGVGQSILVAPISSQDARQSFSRIDILQSDDRSHVGIRAIYLGEGGAVLAAADRFTRWVDLQRVAAAGAGLAGLIGAFLLFLVGQQRIPVAAFALLAAVQFGAFLPQPPAWVVLAGCTAGMTGAAAIMWCRQQPRDWIGWLILGLTIPALAAGLAGFALIGVDHLVPHWTELLQIANNGARPLLIIGAPVSVWRDGQRLIERIRVLRDESQVKDRTIADQRAALDAEMRHAAVLEERQRFARDMHDGIGGHLQGLLMRVRAKRIDETAIADELQSGLVELRLMVDSLDQIDGSLFAALSTFHLRAAPQIEAAGIALYWDLDENVRGAALDPRATLSLYRMLQELVTNCIRHSGATRLSLSLACEQRGSSLGVTASDDGRGFDPAARPAGRGLANMEARVQRIGGSFELASGPDGTKLRFTVPLGQTTLKL